MTKTKLPESDGWYEFGSGQRDPHYFRAGQSTALCGERLLGWLPWLLTPQPPAGKWNCCPQCSEALQQMQQNGAA